MVPFILLAIFAFVQSVQAVPIVYEESTGKILQVGYANAEQFKGNSDIKTKEVPDATIIPTMRTGGGLADLKVVNGAVQQRSAKEINDRKDTEKLRKVIELKLRLQALQALEQIEQDQATLTVLSEMITDVQAQIAEAGK